MKKLTKAEKRVIVDKGTEAPFVGEYVYLMNPVLIFVVAAKRPCIGPKTSLSLIAVGQVLMMKSKVLLIKAWIVTASEPK